jgi:succinoglycan biosynthesis transport protein ExoP
MSLSQFLQIFWARRIFIALCTASCLIGAVIVCLIIPPIWAAHARVMLNALKPDPVTGEVGAGSGYAGAVSFELTQQNLITDYSVLGKAVDDLNWLSDPGLIQQFADRSQDDHRDFRRFAADRLAQNVKVKPVKDSTILEITYTSSSPLQARAVAEALLRAYATTSLQFRTDDATRTANWYEGELAKMKTKLDDATLAEADYEKQNGIIMANDKLDVESQRLQTLAASGAPLVLPPAMVDAAKNTGMELATVNSQITSASKTLGPNNPQMQELVKRKSELTILAAKDEAAARAANSAAATGAGHVDAELSAAKGRVLAKSAQIAHLQTLQQDVDLRRAEYQTAANKFATYRAEADQTSANSVTPLGVDTPSQPMFPNWLLIIPGALALGLVVGILVSLVAEAVNRRVRSVEDLDEGLDLPVIGVIAAPSRGRGESVVRLPRPAAQGALGA